MRKLALLLGAGAALILAAAAASAEDDAAGQARGVGLLLRHRARQALGAKLNLTDDQKAKAGEILQKARQDARNAEGLEAKMAVVKQAGEDLKALLTDEQKATLEQVKQKIKDRLPNLSDEQKEQLKGIWQQARAQAGGVLTDQQKEKVKALRARVAERRGQIMDRIRHRLGSGEGKDADEAAQ